MLPKRIKRSYKKLRTEKRVNKIETYELMKENNKIRFDNFIITLLKNPTTSEKQFKKLEYRQDNKTYLLTDDFFELIEIMEILRVYGTNHYLSKNYEVINDKLRIGEQYDFSKELISRTERATREIVTYQERRRRVKEKLDKDREAVYLKKLSEGYLGFGLLIGNKDIANDIYNITEYRHKNRVLSIGRSDNISVRFSTLRSGIIAKKLQIIIKQLDIEVL